MCIFACGAMVEGVRKWEGGDKKRKWGMAGGVGGEEGDKGSIKICYDPLRGTLSMFPEPAGSKLQPQAPHLPANSFVQSLTKALTAGRGCH